MAKRIVLEKFKYWRYMIELENGKTLVRNSRHPKLRTGQIQWHSRKKPENQYYP